MRQQTPGRARRAVLAGAFPLVSAAVVVALCLVWQQRLPDHIASHFGLHGQADDVIAKPWFPLAAAGLSLGLGALLGGLSWRMRANPQGQRFLNIASAAAAAVLLVANVVTLTANLDVSDPATVVLPGWFPGSVAVAFVFGGLLGIVSTGKLPPVTVDPPADAEPVTTLADTESPSWERTVTSPTLIVTLLLFLPVAAGISILGSPWMLLLFVPLYVAAGSFVRAKATIDDSGLTVRLLTGFRLRFPATHIRSARSRDITPLRDFHGWGWRVSAQANGLILRSGPGLWLYRDGRAPFAITVPDADKAAALLNGLRNRGT